MTGLGIILPLDTFGHFWTSLDEGNVLCRVFWLQVNYFVTFSGKLKNGKNFVPYLKKCFCVWEDLLCSHIIIACETCKTLPRLVVVIPM